MQSDDAIDAIVDRIVERVMQRLLHLPDEYRQWALKSREVRLADLRAFEDLHNLPRSIPSQRDILGGPKNSDKNIPKR